MVLTLILTLLTIKHFVLDFVYQPPYQWQNKGTYGHLGGIVHAGQHSLATAFLLGFFIDPVVSIYIGLIEFVVHYHMDWFKMNYGKKKGWGPTTHNEWFVLLGFDQLVHGLTYAGIIGYVEWIRS